MDGLDDGMEHEAYDLMTAGIAFDRAAWMVVFVFGSRVWHGDSVLFVYLPNKSPCSLLKHNDLQHPFPRRPHRYCHFRPRYE